MLLNGVQLAKHLGEGQSTISRYFVHGKITGERQENGRVLFDPDVVKRELEEIRKAKSASEQSSAPETKSTEPPPRKELPRKERKKEKTSHAETSDEEIEQIVAAGKIKAHKAARRAYREVIIDLAKVAGSDEQAIKIEVKLLRHLAEIDALFSRISPRAAAAADPCS